MKERPKWSRVRESLDDICRKVGPAGVVALFPGDEYECVCGETLYIDPENSPLKIPKAYYPSFGTTVIQHGERKEARRASDGIAIGRVELAGIDGWIANVHQYEGRR